MDEKSGTNEVVNPSPIVTNNQTDVRSYFHVNEIYYSHCSPSSVYIDNDYEKVTQPLLKKHKTQHHSS